MRSKRLALRALQLFAALAALAGAASVWAADQLIELKLTGETLPAAQRSWRVTKGDKITLRIAGDTPGQLHLHAYQVDVKVVPGQTAETSFIAHATGRFRLQFHAAVEKPGAAADRHAGPLATIDVMPQ
jgi:ferric-dicitrate binding protein FerR (iron transport regulator)